MFTFKPVFSFVIYILSLIISVIFIVVLFSTPDLTSKGIMGITFLGFLFFIFIYSTMRYELEEKKLLLRCGPFISRVTYNEIIKVAKIKNLKEAARWRTFGFSLPGYLLGRFQSVTMYATGDKDIILIETSKRKYGLNPENEDKFIEELNKKLEAMKEKI